MILERGALGASWETNEGVLIPPRSSRGDRLDCAWDPRVVLRPGAVNAHTHLYSGLASLGMPPARPEPENFLQILERVWWRLDRALDARLLRASARYALAEALLCGTTTVIDHHESPSFIEGSLEVLADAADELGVRLVVGYGATERNGGVEEGLRGLLEGDRFLNHNRRALVRGVMALHASFTVSDTTAREAGVLARKHGVPVHTHVAEDRADVEDSLRREYPGPLERLLRLEALPPGSIVAHGVHLSDAQVRRAEAMGLWLVQNPRSNEGNRVGYPSALGASQQVALGTDGWVSDLEVEQAALFRLGRAHGESDAVLTARVHGGQRLAGSFFGQRFGAIEAGCAADVVVGVPGERARHVLVAGRCVVRDGRLLTGDFESIRAEAHEAATELWRRM
jgi:cytosine/adenosine deaminase-related metal-dependent hydrolase